MSRAPEHKHIYVVDDDPAVLDSLGALLSAHGYLTTLFATPEAFLAGIGADVRACVLLDLRMPGMSGMDLYATMKGRGIVMPVIFLTAHGDVPVAVKAMKAGAIDFIEKPGSEEELLGAIASAMDVLANRPRATVPAGVVAERLARLTGREREVLDLLVLGMTNKSIADELGISQRTVEIHRARIRDKMEARGLSDLIRMMR